MKNKPSVYSDDHNKVSPQPAQNVGWDEKIKIFWDIPEMTAQLIPYP